MSDEHWETPCPKRVDKIHCVCWYDGEKCCACGAPEMSASEREEQGMEEAQPDPHSTIVVNVRQEGYDVYIGRPTRQRPEAKWGNPFRLRREEDREKVIRQYENWLRDRPTLLADLGELLGKRLGCYCKPRPCHGDVLVRLLIEKFGQKQQR